MITQEPGAGGYRQFLVVQRGEVERDRTSQFFRIAVQVAERIGIEQPDTKGVGHEYPAPEFRYDIAVDDGGIGFGGAGCIVILEEAVVPDCGIVLRIPQRAPAGERYIEIEFSFDGQHAFVGWPVADDVAFIGEYVAVGQGNLRIIGIAVLGICPGSFFRLHPVAADHEEALRFGTDEKQVVFFAVLHRLDEGVGRYVVADRGGVDGAPVVKDLPGFFFLDEDRVIHACLPGKHGAFIGFFQQGNAAAGSGNRGDRSRYRVEQE